MTHYPWIPVAATLLFLLAFFLWVSSPPPRRRIIVFFVWFVPLHMVLSMTLSVPAFMAWWDYKAGNNLSLLGGLLILVGFLLNCPLTPFLMWFIDDIPAGVLKSFGPWLLFANSILFTAIARSIYGIIRRSSSHRSEDDNSPDMHKSDTEGHA